MHRFGLLQRFMARMLVGSMVALSDMSVSYGDDGLKASCHGRGYNGRSEVCFFTARASGDAECSMLLPDTSLSSVDTFSTPSSGVLMDADHENKGENSHIVVTLDHAADEVYYTQVPEDPTSGTFSGVTFTAGAPGYTWKAVGCDRNTAGGASAKWIICTDSSVGGTDTAAFSSTDGENFDEETGWPGATVTDDVNFVGHTCHPSGALGQDDSGNPYWLAITATHTVLSQDGSTWDEYTHGLSVGGGAFNARSAAYSKTSRRWIVPEAGTAFGNIAISEDNGKTWSTTTNALPHDLSTLAAMRPCIASNGYGIFIVWLRDQANRKMWVSVDEGETWAGIYPNDENASFAESAAQDGRVVEAMFDESLGFGEVSGSSEFLVMADLDSDALAGPAPDIDVFRSLLM
jgi:hypothetical protein